MPWSASTLPNWKNPMLLLRVLCSLNSFKSICQGAQIRAIWELFIFVNFGSLDFPYEAISSTLNICRKLLNIQKGLKFPSELQLTTHQLNPSFFGKFFCWFSPKVFELQISAILIFASSIQGLSDGSIKFLLQSTQQLILDKTWFWAIYLTGNKTFLILRTFEIFSTEYVHLGTCFELSKEIY